MRKLSNAMLLVALGAGVYFSIPTLKRWANEKPPAQLVEAPLVEVEVEGATGDVAGNVVVQQCLAALDRRASISVDVLQSGSIAGQIIETHGLYLQQGQNDARRFSLLLQGRIGSSPTRVWQVSDGRFLYTDLAWDGAESARQPVSPSPDAANELGRRLVERIDLRRIRKRISGKRDALRPLAPGRAQADLAKPGLWSGLGGLPMLVDALANNFDFGVPRQMYLRNEPVYAMIGRWKPARRDALLTPTPNPDAPEDAEPPQPVALPDRMPHHVLVAIGARDLFPHLIEYRSRGDQLSIAGLTDEQRFHESVAPLLRMDFLKPKFNEPIDEGRFVYKEPDGVDLHDATSQRLAQIESLPDHTKVVRQPLAPNGIPRR